jgi:hypothetical protein
MTAAETFVLQRIAARMRRRGESVPEDLRELAHIRSSPPRDAAGFAWIKIDVLLHRSDYNVEVNVTSEDVLSWSCDALREPADAELSAGDCLRAAVEAAQPPGDARLVEAKYDALCGTPFFSAVWEHVIDDLKVDGDFIQAYVNGKSGICYAVSRKWHQPNESPSLR